MSEIVSRALLFRGWSSIDQVTVRHEDGSEWVRSMEYHGDAAAVLPYDPVRRVCLMVAMPRLPLLAVGEPSLLEAPAGMLDEGEGGEAAARREALEEAGVRLGELELVVRVWTMPGLSTERVSIFLARYAADDRIADGGGEPSENEQIAVHEIGMDDLFERVLSGRIADGKTLIACQALMLRHREIFGYDRV